MGTLKCDGHTKVRWHDAPDEMWDGVPYKEDAPKCDGVPYKKKR